MSDYTTGILNELQTRLTIVQRRIEEQKQTSTLDRDDWMRSCGALLQLQSERLFLTGLIAEIEKVNA